MFVFLAVNPSHSLGVAFFAQKAEEVGVVPWYVRIFGILAFRHILNLGYFRLIARDTAFQLGQSVDPAFLYMLLVFVQLRLGRRGWRRGRRVQALLE